MDRIENRTIILLGAALFVLACLPFLILCSSSESNAVLGLGFEHMLQFKPALVCIVLVGFLAPSAGRDGTVLVPLIFLLLFAIASLLKLDATVYPLAPWFIFGAFMIAGVIFTLIDTRRFILTVGIGASVAFQLGLNSDTTLVNSRELLFFLLGEFLCIVLIISTAICLSMAVGEYLFAKLQPFLPSHEGFWATTLRSWFL